ncbi:MAG: hypothetical protein K8R40_07845 [Anaerolineaceae bacterium]|nr:hypothetical protein [Anaerolineaceae bacterium]
MKEPRKTILYWCPRVLSILFAAFITLFALDVFGEDYAFGELLVALFMHLVPTFLIIIAIIIGWKREWIGAILFIGLAIFYVGMTAFRMHWTVYLVIPLPLLIIGILYLLSWEQKKKYKQNLQL